MRLESLAALSGMKSKAVGTGLSPKARKREFSKVFNDSPEADRRIRQLQRDKGISYFQARRLHLAQTARLRKAMAQRRRDAEKRRAKKTRKSISLEEIRKERKDSKHRRDLSKYVYIDEEITPFEGVPVPEGFFDK